MSALKSCTQITFVLSRKNNYIDFIIRIRQSHMYVEPNYHLLIQMFQYIPCIQAHIAMQNLMVFLSLNLLKSSYLSSLNIPM